MSAGTKKVESWSHQSLKVKGESWADPKPWFQPHFIHKQKKATYDKCCHMMLDRRAPGKITNVDIITSKGPARLRIYRDDNVVETISDFKTSVLHVQDWKEMIYWCGTRKGKGWTQIGQALRKRLDEVMTLEASLNIQLGVPLEEQDPMIELNRITKKTKRDSKILQKSSSPLSAIKIR